MGLGISAVRYTGMAALQFASIIVWNSAWVCPLCHYRAILASLYAALWLTRSACVMRERSKPWGEQAAVLMGMAIAGVRTPA